MRVATDHVNEGITEPWLRGAMPRDVLVLAIFEMCADDHVRTLGHTRQEAGAIYVHQSFIDGLYDAVDAEVRG